MTAEKFVELHDLLRRYRNAIRNVSDEQLRHALELADEIGDHWAQAQVTRWIARARELQPDWFQLPLGWLRQAAVRRSPWTLDLARYIITGCPMAMVRKEFLEAAERHPAAVAQALIDLIEAGTISPLEVPDIILERLVNHAPGAGGNAAGVVARLLAHLRPEETEWAHRISAWLHSDRLKESRIDIMEALLEGWPTIFPSLAAIR